jgi:predicted DNA-binding protein
VLFNLGMCMRKDVLKISPRYIVDSMGKKTEVILDISTFEQMLENLEDSYFSLQAEQALEKGEFIDFDEANKKIIKQ